MSKLQQTILAALANPAGTLKLLDKLQSEDSLSNFIKCFWKTVEPSRDFTNNWSIDAICEHLEGVTDGHINRLLMNVPPGCMKSLTSAVFWPAWSWGPKNRPFLRFIDASYSQSLTIRDNQRMLRLCDDPLYKELWGDRFQLDLTGAFKITNNKTGWKLATSVGGIGTGERCDVFLVDDPHNVKEANSEAKINEALMWFTEVVPTRMNDPSRSAIVVIMQRVSEGDVAGEILSRDLGYTHLMLPMEYDAQRHCKTFIGPKIFEDPRSEPGELLFPERFPLDVVERDKFIMGPYAAAAQFQQAPSPKGGGIIKDSDWQLWPPEGEKFDDKGRPLKPLEAPPMDYVVASLDTAMTEKEENDWSALTVWGCFRDKHGLPKVMLMYAWQGREDFHGLVETVIQKCTKFKENPISRLLVEAKNTGFGVADEIRRQMSNYNWVTELYNPESDKVARAYAIQACFTGGCVYAPDRSWANMVIEQCSKFPKGKHDDLVDTVTMALDHLRKNGMLLLKSEAEMDIARELYHKRAEIPLPYPV